MKATCRSGVRVRMALALQLRVFDGARAFEVVMSDLDLHCARVNRLAQKDDAGAGRSGR